MSLSRPQFRTLLNVLAASSLLFMFCDQSQHRTQFGRMGPNHLFVNAMALCPYLFACILPVLIYFYGERRPSQTVAVVAATICWLMIIISAAEFRLANILDPTPLLGAHPGLIVDISSWLFGPVIIFVSLKR
jgi:L-asparagine transporter-like permease